MFIRGCKGLLAVVTAALLSSCAATRDSVPFDQLEPALAQAYCAAAERCGQQRFVERVLFGTAFGTCVPSMTSSLDQMGFDGLSEAWVRGTVDYDAVAGAECVHAYDVGCGLPDPWTACQAAFTGTIRVGGECHFDVECIDGGVCAGAEPGGCPVGHCEAVPGLGHACAVSDFVPCQPGLFCAASAGEPMGVCSARRGAGEPCDPFGVQCALGLACRATSSSVGVCSDVRTVGMGEECGFDVCRTGLVCARSDATSRCALPLNDGSCRSLSIGSDCPVDMICVGATASGPGTCQPFPDSGEACVGVCAPGARCDVNTMTCVSRVSYGDACSSYAACPSAFCEAGTCRHRGDCG